MYEYGCEYDYEYEYKHGHGGHEIASIAYSFSRVAPFCKGRDRRRCRFFWGFKRRHWRRKSDSAATVWGRQASHVATVEGRMVDAGET